MNIDNLILVVPVLAACAFMLTMLFVSIEEMFSKRRRDDI